MSNKVIDFQQRKKSCDDCIDNQQLLLNRIISIETDSIQTLHAMRNLLCEIKAGMGDIMGALNRMTGALNSLGTNSSLISTSEANVLVWRWLPDTTVIDLNPDTAKSLGVHRGDKWALLLRKAEQVTMQRFLSQYKPQHPVRRCTHRIGDKWYDWTNIYIFEKKKPIYFVGVGREITPAEIGLSGQVVICEEDE
jgi:hypothetical protein